MKDWMRGTQLPDPTLTRGRRLVVLTVVLSDAVLGSFGLPDAPATRVSKHIYETHNPFLFVGFTSLRECW